MMNKKKAVGPDDIPNKQEKELGMAELTMLRLSSWQGWMRLVMKSWKLQHRLNQREIKLEKPVWSRVCHFTMKYFHHCPLWLWIKARLRSKCRSNTRTWDSAQDFKGVKIKASMIKIGQLKKTIHSFFLCIHVILFRFRVLVWTPAVKDRAECFTSDKAAVCNRINTEDKPPHTPTLKVNLELPIT